MTSELDDLRSFIEQRLKAIDPSFDVSSGSPLDTELITPLVARLAPDPYDTPIDLFARARLKSEYPELVVQKGEPIDDTVIKPFRILMEPFRRVVAGLTRNQSLADPTQLNDREADNLAANYFVRRKPGSYAVGSARLYFSAPRFAIVKPTQAVYTGANLRFFPVEGQAISAESMLFNTEGSLYYFDVVVRAENQGDEYNIEPNSLVGIENFPSVVKVTNPFQFDDGDKRETTEEFLARVERSLTEKSLVTTRGVRARVLELFDSVKALTVIGHGDPEMQRDIITGAPSGDYAFGMLTAVTGASSIYLGGAGSWLNDGSSGSSDFVDAGVEVGDTFRYFNQATGTFVDYAVQEVVSVLQVRVSPAPPDITVAAPFVLKSRNRGQILISDIPGGIVQPNTVNGELVVQNNQVHIGGKYDVFIRAGTPQERSINLSGIRDDQPLHFGLDLESFGAEPLEYVQVTPRIEDAATTTAAFVGPGNATAQILILVERAVDGTVPWYPTAQDVGRFIELLGVNGAGTDWGLYQISAVQEELLQGGQHAVRIVVSTTDQHTGTNTVGISNRSGTFDLDFRIVAQVDPASRVRDRGLPQVNFNGDGDGVGSEVGDSIVIETGPDAGIYSIRRILTSVGEHDTLVLDRDLTGTTTPSGTGQGSGLRYRLDDELQINLVEPRVVKIPLGGIFNGEDLQTVADNPIASVTGTNFLLAGTEVGDTLEILEGVNARQYEVTGVTTTTITLNPAPVSTGFNLQFSVYRAFVGVQRPLVRVKAVELLDSTSQPTGITVPFGDAVDARILGRLSNHANGLDIESFSGQILAGAPLINFRDNTVNFLSQGIRPGFRLEVLRGNSAGEYEIVEVVDANNVVVIGTTDGGQDFASAETNVYYRIGEASVGIVRLYFVEPTSVEIDTGHLGGRLQFRDADVLKRFRFSSVTGFQVFPAPGTDVEDMPRDLRVARSFSDGVGGYQSIVEITDNTNPDAFDAEIREGDVVEVFQQIPFRNSASALFSAIPVFGTLAGLHTLAGSNRVSVPTNSRIDFTQMGTLAGQLLYIESGPDAGRHTISRVIDAKTLELNSIMTSTTAEVRGRELGTLYDAFLEEFPAASGNFYLRDNTDVGQLIGSQGEYITLFESQSASVSGIYPILAVDTANNRVQLGGLTLGQVALAPAGTFSWLRTDSQSLAAVRSQPFHIYSAIPTEVEVVQVATSAPEVRPLGTCNIVAGLVTAQGVGPSPFAGVVRGDRLEILYGPNAGVYPILTATPTAVTVYTAQAFNTIEVGAPYRVWAGVHGPRRMLTVRSYEGSDARLFPGVLMPYRVRRPGVERISSTAMQDNDDNGLFYLDMQIESLGPGDDRNLERNSRMEVTRGMRVDGYTYTVENNTLTFSSYEEVSLTFDRRFLPVGNTDLPENRTEISGRNLQIRYETSPTVQVVNNLLRSDAERVVTADPIARHFLPSYVFVRLAYQGGSSVQVVGPDVESYINNLDPLLPLEVSDLEKFVSRRGATSIRHPIVLVAVTHDLDRRLVAERSEDQIGSTVVPYNGSARITNYFAVLDEGLIVERS